MSTKERRVLRAVFTKEANYLEELLKGKFDENELEARFNSLVCKYDKIIETDDIIKNDLLSDENTKDEDLQIELETAGNYQYRFLLLKKRVEKIIKEDSSSISNHSCCNKELGQSISGKLPEISNKFDGDLGNWIGFWTQFSRINDSNRWEDEDKFEILLRSLKLGSSPRKLVQGFPPSKENYAKAVDLLKQRFGREDLLIEYYVRQLLNLVLSKDNVGLSSLYDRLETQLRALGSMGVTQEKYAAMLFPLVESAVPEPLFKIWERVRNNKNTSMKKPDECLQELLEFLRIEVEGEERLKLRQESFEKKTCENTKVRLMKPDVPSAAALVTTDSSYTGRVIALQCIFCDKKHLSQECITAVDMPLEKLNEMVKKKGACYRCLRSGHLANKCKVMVKCIICKGKHFPILCNKKNSSTHQTEEKVEVGSYATKVSSSPSHTYLQTLLVQLVTSSSETILVRALLDSGSMKSYISENLIDKCCLEPVRSVRLAQELFGGHTTTLKTRNIYNINLRSFDNSFEHNFDLIEQGKICGKLSRCQEPSVLTALEEKGIILTDLCDEGILEVDILLGADAWPAIYSDKYFVINNMLAIHTKLGWTVTGTVSRLDTKGGVATSLLIKQTNEISLSNLWDLEVLGISDAMSKEQKIEQDVKFFQEFENSIYKSPESRYVVKLPFKEGSPPLEDNRWHAESRLLATTQKLKQQGLYEIYDNVLQDWKDSSIVEVVPEEEVHINSFYLPHRAVVKEESTTKCRPVFDAGCKDKFGHSLNEILEKGPNLIERIPTSLINFRKGPVGISADIEKAFLQIVIDEKDRDFLRFLWWDSNSGRVVTMRHCRVVFGVSSSPFQLCAVLKHHLMNSPFHLKNTADKLMKAFYVDNCLTAVENENDYAIFKKEAQELLIQAGFNLRGWTTNKHNTDQTVNILGLNWICGTDQLRLNIKNILPNFTEKWTRRTVLSVVHKIFDPIGLAAPFTLIPRIILQDSWNSKGRWDDELPTELQKRFQSWVEDVPLLHECSINREIKVNDNTEVHIMCDASKIAYAACIFVVTADKNENRNVELVMAKTRVAPMKLLTIPRLELMAATLGVRLYNSIFLSLGVSQEKLHFWTDSSVVLSWITNPGPWSVFVSNRTREIITLSNQSQWKHLPGNENPADLLSRGCNGQRLISSRWWEGPSWLKLDSTQWPKTEVCKQDCGLIDAERRKTVISAVATEISNFSDSFQPISNYKKILLVVAWCLRWKNKKRGAFDGDEIKTAEKRLIKCVQEECFKTNKELHRTMLIVKDNEGLLRVKTKLLLAEEDANFICPILIPSNHFVTERMIRSFHLTNQHAVVSILLGIIREEFWIPRGRRTVKKVVSACIKCKRYNRSKPLDPPLAPLPKDRVTQRTVFEVSGVDLAGPMYLKGGGKVWIVIFTCAVYRAIHLELVNSLSSLVFIRALRRFIARRGRISVLYADNGTNFHGTFNYLSELDWDEITKTTALKKITWKFNPPTAAWWGGWWERLIGLLKPLLVRNLGKSSLDLDELSTLIYECEALINERPLTYVSDESTELKPLKPSMFLRELPTCDVGDINSLDSAGLNRRLKYLQKIREGLKQRFRTEYLALLVHHGKRKNQQVKVGDIVLIGSDMTKRIQWPMGRVIEVFPGVDGKVRVVKVKTESGVFTRPLQRLYPLEVCGFEDKRELEQLASKNNKLDEDNDMIEEKTIQTKSGRTIRKPKTFDN